MPCLSACPSMATCSVSSTVTWLRTCSTPKRGWMSLSTSWTHRNLSLKWPQESLTTGERDVKAAVPLFVHSHVQVIIIIFYGFSSIYLFIYLHFLLSPVSPLPGWCSGLEILTLEFRTTTCTSSAPASKTKTTACCGVKTRSETHTHTQHAHNYIII